MRDTTEFRELMEEPPGGPNHGRAASPDPNVDGRWLPLGVDDAQAYEFLRGGGWTLVSHAGGEWSRSGGTAHRGVLRGDEHVDDATVLSAIEQALGFTAEQVRSVYARSVGGGPLPRHLRELRGSIDARLLALSRSGANLLMLARRLGLSIKEGDDVGGGTCDAVSRALVRAKQAELQTEGSCR